nr:hypothetical protein [Tanacetum cinerariifolium]GEW80738.1 hypothetical protein [Tanacetum cinerariifolium]
MQLTVHDNGLESNNVEKRNVTTSTKKPASKPKSTKKKASVKADRGKILNVLSKVALSEATQPKEATKRSKKDFHISHASGSGDGTYFESGVPDEQQRKISVTDEGTGAKPGVLDVPKYDFENDDDNDGNDDGDDSNGNDDDDDDGDDDSDHEKTVSNRDENPNLIQSSEEHEEEEEEEEYVDEFTDKEDDADYAKEENEEEIDDAEELYKDEEEDAHVTLTDVHDAQKTEGPTQSSSISSDFTKKLLNFENVSPADNEIASLMDTTVHHEEPSSHTSSFYTVPVIVIPEITYAFTTTIPPPPLSFNPLLQLTTLTTTPIASEVTTAFLALPDFASIFKFNDRVTNLERDLSEIKQVDREEALANSREYTDLIDKKSMYKAAASLFEFELTKILMDKMEEHKSYLIADYKREIYDALVKSYNTNKDIFDTYDDVFMLKRSQYDKDKDQDPFAGLDRGTKRRKSSKDVESSKDPKYKESKSTSSSKGTSRSQHKSSGKSAHVEDPSHTVGDSRVQQNQEFDTGNNDEQTDDEAAFEVD